jgi:hypothetical protein
MWSDPAESTSLKSAFALSSWTVHTGCNVSPSEGEGAEEVVRDLDTACLLLCIALLDHTLQGDHFESVVLSFLAVLGIGENPGGVFRGTLTSTYSRALTEESPGCSFSRVTLSMRPRSSKIPVEPSMALVLDAKDSFCRKRILRLHFVSARKIM